MLCKKTKKNNLYQETKICELFRDNFLIRGTNFNFTIIERADTNDPESHYLGEIVQYNRRIFALGVRSKKIKFFHGFHLFLIFLTNEAEGFRASRWKNLKQIKTNFIGKIKMEKRGFLQTYLYRLEI